MSELHLSGGSGPTVRRMLLGAQLRRLRGEAGLSREEAGAAIRASAWKIHRLENGQVSFKERDVVDLLGLYGVGDAGQVAAFVLMAREANLPGWWQHFGDLLPAWFRAFVDLESAASLIRRTRGSSCRGCCRPRRTAGRSPPGRCWTSRPRRWSGGWRCGSAARGCWARWGGRGCGRWSTRRRCGGRWGGGGGGARRGSG